LAEHRPTFKRTLKPLAEASPMQRHGTFGEGSSQQYDDTADPAAQTGGMQLGAGC